jgi:hypothetical protein
MNGSVVDLIVSMLQGNQNKVPYAPDKHLGPVSYANEDVAADPVDYPPDHIEPIEKKMFPYQAQAFPIYKKLDYIDNGRSTPQIDASHASGDRGLATMAKWGNPIDAEMAAKYGHGGADFGSDVAPAQPMEQTTALERYLQAEDYRRKKAQDLNKEKYIPYKEE